MTKCEIELKRSARDIVKVLSAYIAIPYHPICRRVGANRPSRRASMCRPTFDHALSYLPMELKNSLSRRTKEDVGAVWHYLTVHFLELQNSNKLD